jgi:predicted transglutaminase-like cysteine proteinase
MMNILPVARPLDLFPVPQVKPQAPQPKLELTEEDISKLLPTLPKDAYGNFYGEDIVNLWDTIPDLAPAGSYFPIADILRQKYEFSLMLFQFNQNSGVDPDSGDDYEKYLQFPNQRLSDLAYSIVDRSDSDDEKVYKIEQWVTENIEYVSDIKNYGTDEFWAYPTITLNKGKGDCDDGAFLIHSLALHAGVPMDRLRTYGGFVEAEEGSFVLAGHCWTAYRRESDDEWVDVDWCYYPTDAPLSERVPMQDDTKYVDDFFYFDATKTVDASLLNRIRKPVGGGLINIYA